MTGVQIKDASIFDITPTAMYLMGLPIPNEMDGRVIEEAIRPEYLMTHPVNSSSDSGGEVNEVVDEPAGFTPEDEERIRKQLKDLGYLG